MASWIGETTITKKMGKVPNHVAEERNRNPKQWEILSPNVSIL